MNNNSKSDPYFYPRKLKYKLLVIFILKIRAEIDFPEP